MTIEPLVSQQVKSANKFLWAVKTYIDLITRDDQLVFGSGLKRLYAMASGVATLNDRDIEAIAAKSERLHLTPHDLQGFMASSILSNIELYGKELQRIMQNRIIGIANGDIRNPDPLFKFSAEEARRYYYTPPTYFVARIQKALEQDVGMQYFGSGSVSLQDVANDAELVLTRMQIDEGHLSPTQTSWGALVKVIEGLVAILEIEARHGTPDRNQRIRARNALKILWCFAKILLGDLTAKPLPKDINLVDLNQKLNLSDGTLAAIPFPLRETVEVFSDDDGRGVSLKGRLYLSAVSAAAFYRSNPEGSSDED